MGDLHPPPPPRTGSSSRLGCEADSDPACPQHWFPLRTPWIRCPGPGAAAMEKENISLCLSVLNQVGVVQPQHPNKQPQPQPLLP